MLITVKNHSKAPEGVYGADGNVVWVQPGQARRVTIGDEPADLARISRNKLLAVVKHDGDKTDLALPPVSDNPAPVLGEGNAPADEGEAKDPAPVDGDKPADAPKQPWNAKSKK